MATKLQIRRDTASNWTSANPTLSAGEFGYETDTNKLKIGNGSTAWTSLDYFVGDINGYLAGGNVQHIIPAGNELYDLGDSDSRFRDLYLSGSTIRLGSVTLSVDSSNALVLPSGTKLGSVNVLDSAGVQSVIDQTYIRNNQIKYSTAQFTDSAFVTTQINNLIDGAPGTLNTLNEIAAALNDDDSAYGTLLGLINAKTNYDSADTLGLIDSAYVQARQTAGGGGGSLTAIASGTLANGDLVVVNSNGTVSVVTDPSASFSVGSASSFNGNTDNSIATVYDSNSDKVVVIYCDKANNNYGTAVVGTVSGNSISFGSEVVISTGGTNDHINACFDTNSNKVVITYRKAYSPFAWEARVGTVSGTSISFGSAATVKSAQCFILDCAFDPDTNQVVFVGIDTDNSYKLVYNIGSVSGTSITMGSPCFVTSGSAYNPTLAYDTTSNKMILSYRDNSNNQYGSVKVGTVSSGSVSWGSTVYYQSSRVDMPHITYDPTNDRIAVFYNDYDNSETQTVIVGTVSGSSVTFGTKVAIRTGYSAFFHSAFNPDNDTVGLISQVSSNLTYTPITVASSGNTATVGTASSLGLDASGSDISNYYGTKIAHVSSQNKMAFSFQNSSTSGQTIIFNDAIVGTSNLTTENFIGVSNGAYDSGDTATIQVTGSIDDAQTGLTAGQRYFVQKDGTLSTSPDTISVIAGTAVSSTELLINADHDTFKDSAFVSGLIDSAYIQARQSDIFRDSAFVTGIIDSAYVQARQTSGGSGTVDSDQVISIINNNTNSGFTKYRYTATAGQTVFQDSDASGNILSFDPNSTIVFYNGVMLDETTDYTASSNAITLTSGADAGVSLSVVKFGVGYVAPTYWYGDRGLWIGGINNSNTGQNVIDYIDITSTGNATDFGDLSNTSSYRQATVSNSSTIAFAATGSNVEYVSSSTTGNSASFGSLTDTRSQMAGVSDATTGCFGGGSANVIDKITIATPGNATDFGDLTVSRSRLTSGKGGTTRGLFIGGGSTSNVIDYITIATAGNAIDFGDITSYGSHDIGGAGNDTRVLYAAGQHTNNNTLKRIEYVNPATTGNGSSFGNVSYWSHMLDGANNQTRACWSGYNTSEPGTAAQNHIEYVTIDTTGDASDFGDLTASRAYVGGASGNAS